MKLENKIQINEQQKLIAKNRYLMLDKNGKPRETIDVMFRRIAKHIASAETKYKTSRKDTLQLEKDFYEMMANFEFLSGFALSDRGRRKLMAACYVLPLEDSLESIYKTLYESVQLHRLGAGVGYDFSPLRPEGSLIKSTGKESSGPISFMQLFDFSSEIILNRGSARHAGHMGILRIDHPDIEKFIAVKEDLSQLTNFNISVAITDKFMQAYEKGDDFLLKHPNDGKTTKKVSARNLMASIAKSAHASGEPGVIFIDEINKKNTLPKLLEITATNLCGEQPLLPYEACNLGSVNLTKFVNKNNIHWEKLEKILRLAVRFLDNTIDIAYYVFPQIEKIVKKGNRKIGLGIMGWADMLAKLSIPYDSKKALEIAEELMGFIQKITRDESSKQGKLKGNFGSFKKSIFSRLGYKNMRNATITTIAPTGTISLFADCNGGIEPFFALAYNRSNMETLGNKKLIIVNKILEEKLKEEWLFSKELMKKILKSGSIQNIKGIPDGMKKIFKTAYEIEPLWHLKMQAAFQKFTDNAVSKTINVAEDISIKEIEKIYLSAYKLKLKGVTIYRNRSRDKQVLNIQSK
ncbi:adenosylcobalamin-dependent ribonucleoside-diphosphate reductase [Candidatus Dojkabacteria bacterium]|nr:adenosylcobalamin-dependent ribonucleoside-diphosphate reductase [Candidatus Dojkabacteria bacterium]